MREPLGRETSGPVGAGAGRTSDFGYCQSMAPATQLRFAKPPVRTARLTYFFRTSRPLLAIEIGAVCAAWRSDYPLVDELPPRAPISDETGRRFVYR